MQSTIYQGVYVGPTMEGVIRQGDVTTIARVDFSALTTVGRARQAFTIWEAKPRNATVYDAWLPVDRLDVVIPGHEQPAVSELRAMLSP